VSTDKRPAAVMFDLITRYWHSKAVGVAAKLGIADEIGDGEKTAAEIATALGTDPSATERLIRGIAALGLLAQSRPGVYRLTELGQLLRSDGEESMRAYAVGETEPGHWLTWNNLEYSVRTGNRASPGALGKEMWDYLADNPEEARWFSGGMSSMGRWVARDLAASGLVPRGATVADIGGAEGLLASAILHADPTAQGILLDLPNVVAASESVVARTGLAERMRLVGGDFFKAVPEADVYLLKQVLHDWTDEQCVTILANCARSLRPGGRVIIVEFVLPDGDEFSEARMMDLNMLVMLPGRERSAAEYEALLEKAGLKHVATHPTTTAFSLIEARVE